MSPGVHVSHGNQQRKIVRRSSLKSPREMQDQHGRYQLSHGRERSRGGDEGMQLQRRSLDVGLEGGVTSGQTYQSSSQSSSQTGQTGFPMSQTSSQSSWDGGSPTAPSSNDTAFKRTR